MGTSGNIYKILLLLFLMNQVPGYISLSSTITLHAVGSQSLMQRLFHCKSGEYVKSTDFCDSVNDCADGSDEPSQCKSENCGVEGKFLCVSTANTTNITCIQPKQLCDTRKDCPDGSDEANCGDEVKTQDCPLSKGKFLCKDTLRCLDLEYTCDGSCNCFDCSDESKNCTKREERALVTCPHSYFPTPSGLRCFCNPYDGTFDSLCKEMKECPAQNSCDQRCSQYKNKMLCSCHEDYTEILVNNGFKCRSREYYGTRMIYSTSNNIKALNVTSKEVEFIKKNVQCKLLAAAQGVIYYTTHRANGTSIFMISSGETSEIIKTDSSINSIAVDYITDNVYFTTAKQSLSVCSKNGRTCVQLKCCDVAYVTIAPKFGWMFYTKKSDIANEYFIMKSSMDGSDENILIDGTWRGAFTMTIDESFARLYLQDNNGISSISLRDYSIEKHYIKLGHDPESLIVLDEILFYTTSRDDRIFMQENLESFVKSSHKNQDFEEEVMRYRYYEYNQRPTDTNYTLHKDTNATISIKKIAAYNSIRQLNSKAKNPCKNMCTNLCLLRPAATSKSSLRISCVCEDFSPSDDQHWCTDPSLDTNLSNVGSELKSSSSQNSVSFVEILFALVAFAALLGGAYILYQKFYNSVMYSKRSRPRSERIYDPDQSEI